MATAAEMIEKDYFTDHSVLLDPYDYFNAIRPLGPIQQMKARDILVVTGFREAVEILLDAEHFSSFINPDPLSPLPFEPVGDDISGQIAVADKGNPMLDLMVAYDGDRHAAARSLLNPLFRPSRLKANEAFMRSYGDEMARELVAKGGCEAIAEIATPFVTMVIADLLGVPEDDREAFRKVIDAGPPPGNMDAADQPQTSHPLVYMASFFMRYLTERRAAPREDVMTDLALARYPDGSEPPLIEAVKTAMFLFAAGQDTSAKLIGNALRYLCDNPAMQDKLRADRTLIVPFLEEMLRLEGSTKATFRVCQKATTVGGFAIPAGKKIIIAVSAANRDPVRWEQPNEFVLDRPRVREHLAFGRGAHTCAGAPLARAEVAVLLDRLLEHTSAITLSEEHHGPLGARTIEYEASYIIRGLAKLFVRFEGV